ncbi:PEPxxWA-CTERM sorting domain-containing protein [Erythrobacter sp. LQ02-29]|uniref:PEPxxWA-CTERM sorting domain-containing protein n=1 Tax=Erythrobacter sp. LQ02-29 TaxID=2920384 RepID=UPI001F4DB340|nr:PEPxxWA-CTERM sorting domain-containing protein [Erythrobacter sp. LQ02-29]MCP9221521.1 PEPxxWA-CTERM sorting domain-containing protein [Erythrobacter sp. LQ02-29]
MKRTFVAAPASLFALVGMAGSANAATTIDVDYEPTVDGTPITIGGASSPQYTFTLNEFSFDGENVFRKTYLNANGTARIGEPGQPATQTGVNTQSNFSGPPTGGDYSLLFDIGNTRYSGTATVDPSGYHLTQISYEALGAGGVPEPATWALMILGMGAAGAAMRRRNQAAPRPAIA